MNSVQFSWWTVGLLFTFSFEVQVQFLFSTGAQKATEAVLPSVSTEIKGILSSDPLGFTSSDVMDPDPITPNSVFTGRQDTSLPQVVYEELRFWVEEHDNILRYWLKIFGKTSWNSSFQDSRSVRNDGVKQQQPCR